jgi:hypothetical protein
MNTIAWGAGSFFSQLSCHGRFRVHRLVDGDPEKWGTRVCGLCVEDPAKVFQKADPATTVVLIYASRAAGEIKARLAQWGPFLSVDLSELIDPERGGGPDPRDMIAAARDLATADSAQYVMDHMLTAPHHATAVEMLGELAVQVSIQGMFMEFGVARGSTIRIIAGRTSRTVWGFDSFEGLPEAWNFDSHKGAFKCQVPTGLPGNVQLVAGMFDATLAPFLEAHPGPVAFLHMDVDLYQSCRTVLALAGSRLTSGSVIVFDEYLNYPGWRNHEYRAFQEFIGATGLDYEYVGFVTGGEAVAVRIR